MSEQLQIITSSNRSHTVRLFAIWLFLIVMPALVLVVSFDMLLKDSEGYIKDTLKIRMVQELGDFRSKLSFARMVELKMHRLTSKTRLLDSDAESLARTINQQLQIPAAIVFHLNPQTGKFSSHVADSISTRLGMLSRTMLQNYLTSVMRNS
ncbi:MAG TPA: hypothetical protein DCG57_09725 [Candidatus Riflebacteria bacterium]|nr:hypothetical protein [Candidatus Riflebacteria bacterium]